MPSEKKRITTFSPGIFRIFQTIFKGFHDVISLQTELGVFSTTRPSKKYDWRNFGENGNHSGNNFKFLLCLFFFASVGGKTCILPFLFFCVAVEPTSSVNTTSLTCFIRNWYPEKLSIK